MVSPVSLRNNIKFNLLFYQGIFKNKIFLVIMAGKTHHNFIEGQETAFTKSFNRVSDVAKLGRLGTYDCEGEENHYEQSINAKGGATRQSRG